MLSKNIINEALEGMKQVIQKIIDDPEIGVQTVVAFEVSILHREFFKFLDCLQNELERGNKESVCRVAEPFLKGCFTILSKDIETIKTEMMHFSETAKEMRKKKEASEK